MEIHFVKQRVPTKISVQDVIVLTATHDEQVTSGKYTVVMLTESEDDPNAIDVTLVGTDNTNTAGTISVITLGGGAA